MRGLSWAVVLVAALAGQAGAQTVASGTLVTGTVQDQTGAVLPGAIVDLVSSAGTIAQTVQADAGGAFRFDNVRAGQYELRARFEGFKSASPRLRVAARAPGPQRLVLGLANLRQEITVSNVPTQVDAAAGNNVDAVPYTEMLGQDLYNNGRGARARPACRGTASWATDTARWTFGCRAT